MSAEWEQVGTVEVTRLRIYPLDPQRDMTEPLCTTVAVEPGVYPVYRKYDAFQWVMAGRVNERMEKIGDGLFAMHGGDTPTGVEVRFPSKVFGREQFEEFLTETVCQPGPFQRLIFDVAVTA